MTLPNPEHLFTDGTTLPMGALFCIGRNYREHAAEMNAEVPKEPLVFLKPNSAYLPSGSLLALPSFSALVHHEVELVIVIGEEAVDIPESSALRHIAGVAVGLDLTLRDLQDTAKKKGEPWAVAKGFRGSAPLSKVVPFREVRDISSLTVALTQNGALRQRGVVSDMERSIPNLICYLSKVFGLRRGDCIFTGTPKGVGPIRSGDTLHAEIEGLVALDIQVA